MCVCVCIYIYIYVCVCVCVCMCVLVLKPTQIFISARQSPQVTSKFCLQKLIKGKQWEPFVCFLLSQKYKILHYAIVPFSVTMEFR